MAFRFKQFTVEDDRSTMKVGTDAVLLAAWIRMGDPATILDVGTGSGVIALMMAQRSGAMIDAIDIDPASVRQAQENFRSSPWSQRLNAINVSFEDFSERSYQPYDIIISNPPFFINSLKSSSAEKKLARHTSMTEMITFIRSARKLLNPSGLLAIINPVEGSVSFTSAAAEAGFYCTRMTSVIPKEGKKASRILLEFQLNKKRLTEDSLTILDSKGNYDPAYQQITKAYYLNF